MTDLSAEESKWFQQATRYSEFIPQKPSELEVFIVKRLRAVQAVTYAVVGKIHGHYAFDTLLPKMHVPEELEWAIRGGDIQVLELTPTEVRFRLLTPLYRAYPGSSEWAVPRSWLFASDWEMARVVRERTWRLRKSQRGAQVLRLKAQQLAMEEEIASLARRRAAVQVTKERFSKF